MSVQNASNFCILLYVYYCNWQEFAALHFFLVLDFFEASPRVQVICLVGDVFIMLSMFATLRFNCLAL